MDILSSSSVADIISFAAEYLFTVWFFSRFERNQNIKKVVIGHMLLLLIGYLFLPFIIPGQYADRISVRSAISFLRQIGRMLIHWVPVFLYALLSKEISYKQALYLSGVFTCYYLMIQNIRSALRLAYRISTATDSNAPLMTYIVIIIEAAGLFLILKLIDITRVKSIDRFRWMMLIIPMLISLYVKWTLRTSAVNVQFAAEDIDSLPYAILASVGVFCVLLLYEISRTAQELQKKAEMEQLDLGYEVRSAKRTLQSSDDIRRLYHDMKNHLLAIKSMSDNTGKVNEYLSQLLPKFDSYESHVSTGSAVVDSILSEKIQRTMLDGIQFNVCLDLNSISNVTAVDQVTIFANAVDNSIEAVKKLPDRENRIIYLKSNQFANMLTIRISNQFLDAPNLLNGTIVTQKVDKTMHGLGLTSIQKAVERYGGSVNTDIDQKTNWFNLVIMIPVAV